MSKRFKVLLHGNTPGTNPIYEDVGADEYQLHNGVLVFLVYQNFGEPPAVAIAYAQGAWICFSEVSE
jgi:hypothetical protein